MYSHSSAGLRWRKSSYSTDHGPDCVEVAHAPGMIAVRDSKDLSGPILTFAAATFAAFLTSAKHDRLT